MSKPEETLAKAIADLEEVTVMAKARVGAYTRKDGTFVQEHDDGRAPAVPKPGSTKRPAVKAGHMDVGTLAAGHHLFDKNGQKVDEVESVEKHPMGGFRVNTRAGYSHMVGKDGHNAHGLTNRAPGGSTDRASGETSAAERRVIARKTKELKNYHTKDAKMLKSSLGKALSRGDTETDDGKQMTYGHVKYHLSTMRSQLGSDPAHKEHLDHAQHALNQSFGNDNAPVSEKHAKLIGAALSGKTRVDDNGMVRHASSGG